MKNRENIEARNAVNRTLAAKAWQRVFSADSDFGEKVAAVAVTIVMNAKSQLGMGLGKKNKMKLKKRVVLKKIVDAAKKSISPSKSAQVSIKVAVDTYDETVLSERNCREWFQKFQNGEFDIEDKERSGRPKVYKAAVRFDS